MTFEDARAKARTICVALTGDVEALVEATITLALTEAYMHGYNDAMQFAATEIQRLTNERVAEQPDRNPGITH